MGCCASLRSKKIASPENRMDSLHIDAGTFVLTNDKRFQEVYMLRTVVSTSQYYEVRAAIHRETNEDRLVKIFRKDITPKIAYEKLKIEIAITKTIDHPNVIKFFEIFEEPSKVYISMEQCKGGELFEEILKRKNFSEQQVAKIMKEIFSALAYMHEQGIVHRDLKPENILLEDKDDLINIKIINFSTATILKKDAFLSGVIGTAYYIAPEVITSNYNEKCDIWSAGVVMFMLLSFYPPFDGNSDKEILEKVQRGTINYKNPIWTSISNQAKDLISKLLCPLDQRLSATEVLTHPFIVENALIPDSDQQNLVSAFQNLRGFRNSNKLRDAVQTFIATQCISAHDSKALKEVFKTIDTNGDGKLSKEELLSHYKKVMGDDHAEEEVSQIMKEVDTDNNGYINYTEFLKASISQKTLVSSQNLRRAFDLFDSDKSGSISAAELKKVLQGGNNTDDHVWKQIIKAFDQNSDGEIDLREFEEIITRSL
ncbi:hypothetical protein SteCoe_30949 [Stentor coeruleus]|uniref:Calmodulin n=1 Tax=Stentor coeruleus TaxID=5963 RepID=A0A1R2B2E6_9CILI|nr:hypothetical protein SteCoe_30949 [Stentor coeruleus]